jgi:hypothetical protein
VRIVVDAQRRAVLEDYARRAFNLDREDVEWILEPANFKFLPVERAGSFAFTGTSVGLE